MLAHHSYSIIFQRRNFIQNNRIYMATNARKRSLNDENWNTATIFVKTPMFYSNNTCNPIQLYAASTPWDT